MQAAFRWFTRFQTNLRRLATVIYSVAQQMGQRSLEPLENITVDLRVFAVDVESNLFTQRARKVANHPRKTPDPFPEWPHPRPQDFQIKPLRKMGRTAVELVQFLDAFS